MNKKKLFSLAVVVIIVAILSFSTLAWFNDSDSVTNEFFIASSDDTNSPESIFSVDVWEKVDTDGDGVADTVNPGQDVDGGGAEFKNILPGSRYVKEPTIENTGAYDQYIRVVVTVTDGKAWLDTFGSRYDLTNFFEGHDESLWTRGSGEYIEATNELVYVYYLDAALAPKATAALFTHIKFPTSLTQQQMAKLNGGFELSIRADAIQTENLGEGVDTAAEAFEAVQWGIEDEGPKA